MGTRTESERVVDRRWKGIPIQEADADLLIFITKDDVRKAVPGDPAKCAASLACKRLYQSTGVEFFHTVAYVDLPDPEGTDPSKRVILRFRLDDKTARMIEELDGGGSPAAGGYRLRKPEPSETLDKVAEYQQSQRSRVREARIKGEIYQPNIRPGSGQRRTKATRVNTPLTPGMNGYVRSGTGQVQMKRLPVTE